MRERPIADLVDGLKQLGVKVECTLGTGCPPVEVVCEGLPGGQMSLAGSVSSQYLTAVLMAAPLALGDLTINISDTLVSVPYVDMTIKIMERFGAKVEHGPDFRKFVIRGGQKYTSPGHAYVEGDASSASYFMAVRAPALSPGGGSCAPRRAAWAGGRAGVSPVGGDLSASLPAGRRHHRGHGHRRGVRLRQPPRGRQLRQGGR